MSDAKHQAILSAADREYERLVAQDRAVEWAQEAKECGYDRTPIPPDVVLDMAAELAALRAELNAQSIALGDEIVALRAEVEGLRGALGNIRALAEKSADHLAAIGQPDGRFVQIADFARRALGGTDA